MPNYFTVYTNAWHLVFIEALRRVEKLAGRSVKFHKVDITSEQEIDAIFEKYTFWAVIHFAALKVRNWVIFSACRI